MAGVGFDCSGLCQWAYSKAGVSIPRVAAGQQSFCHSIPKSALSPGDLVFTGTPAHHVVMSIGNGRVVAAPHTGAKVQIESLDGNGFGTGGFGRVP